MGLLWRDNRDGFSDAWSSGRCDCVNTLPLILEINWNILDGFTLVKKELSCSGMSKSDDTS
jgi:hypothetical protein